MTKEKDKIDELIKETLSKEEAAFYDTLEETHLIGKLEGVYRGKLGWLAVLMTVIQLIIFILFIVFLLKFLNVETTAELIKWGAAGFLCLIAMSMLKLFIWLQMDKNDILKELKKLELQVASLAERSA